ncbi:hypothetical protein HYFRA_00007225 [Hymenoscyphus fraxineus]|uniref:AAA+ ATPase domain-containing protein n=1 Tax=Hymenoscyphus fraxineus TaxID=746836 RepID=A0A9N9KXC2_9HELO|nr:hypothetical protein HYFRA_00007225 [Hymenoscyphus fraxineus]
MPSKRKLEHFDPNKSDSADTDFDPTEYRAPARKTSRKSTAAGKKNGRNARKRTKRRGSQSDDDDNDSLLEDISYSDPSQEEEKFEMNEKTGRAVRKAAKKSVNYEEGSSESVEESTDSTDDAKPNKKPQGRRRQVIDDDEDEAESGGEGEGERQEAASEQGEDDEAGRRTPPVKSRIVTLKIKTPALTRGLRNWDSTTRRTRGASKEQTPDPGPEPISATMVRRTKRATSAALGGEPTERRTTRATSAALGDDAVVHQALSNSGRHAIRDSHSPQAVGRRATRGAKSVLPAAASTIKEEIHDLAQDGEDVIMATATEIAGTDERDEVDSIGNPEDQTPNDADADDDDDDDEGPISRPGRASRQAVLVVSDIPDDDEPVAAADTATAPRRLTRGSKKKEQKRPADASSDFEPVEESAEEDISASDADANVRKGSEESGSQRRSRRDTRAKSKSTSRRRASPTSEVEEELIDQEELAEELHELKASSRRHRRRVSSNGIVFEQKSTRAKKPVNYKIMPMDQVFALDEDAQDDAPTPNRRSRGGRNGASQPWERNLYSTYGPFGGGGGPPPVIGGPWGTGAAGGADSDSSDEENMARPTNVGGNVGMTPTSAMPGLLPGLAQTNPEPAAALSGTPANLGKVKSQKALADADPLGVDQNVDFSKIGGLDGHIDQLKEMVQMPLLYPELFMKFHVTPPRGVLFHGPPGTGKTLLARALAATVGSGGRKITFYMRKGADALSKWVGEAERQLRLLFEEARKTQPSIIFFDEIDGLAPVRSSKQEQIHASIVSTLLALMDGMDGRGQVIVIGATNRPDNIDPALRRPGRFDREFYFPLPDVAARKSIININTKDWGIDDSFKDSLAHVTKGYGGADLRALCTEAALNAIQRTYPQIYQCNDKLIVDPDKIKITAKDFMLSVKKIIPSSERSTSSGAAPLPKRVEPLLRDRLSLIENALDDLIPIKKKTTALQEAMFEQYDDADLGFGRETMQQEFENSRVFRPRLLICGEPGMGQGYLGGAILNHFEGLHVQSFDLPTIFSDSARSPETALVQLFAEVKRHKPSVIYIPGVETWYQTLSDSQMDIFLSLLRSIPPTDPVLVLGITENRAEDVDPRVLTNLFGFSSKNRIEIQRPSQEQREAFFSTIIEYVKKTPQEFPEPLNRKKRKLEVLEVAPLPPPKPPTKEELKAQKKKDHQLLNILKVQIQPIMDQIQKKYRKFRTPAIQQSQIQYLIDEQDPNFVRPDIPQFRPYELDTDKNGINGLRETASGKFFYNLETTTIEERLSNGFYARPKDFLQDIKSLAKDAKHMDDRDRLLKANELVSNVEVDIMGVEAMPQFADCENVYQRQLQRSKERAEKEKMKDAPQDVFGGVVRSDIPDAEAVILNEPAAKRRRLETPVRGSSSLSNGVTSDLVTNGSSAHPGYDTQMSGANDHSQPFSQTPMHPPSQMRGGLSGPAQNSQISQRSTFQEIPHGTSPSQLINDASTTTSGKKTSEGWSTQATNGIAYGALNSSPIDRPQDSQLPDTQQNTSLRQSQQGASDPSSDDQWPHSQAQGIARGILQGSTQTPSSGSQYSQNPAVPAFKAPSRAAAISKPSGFANILNDSPVEEIPSSQPSQDPSQDFVSDTYFVEMLLGSLIKRSSGLNVEQLEQVNRELMETIWKMRGEWNRNKVAATLVEVFNETVNDIEAMQQTQLPSQQSQL